MLDFFLRIHTNDDVMSAMNLFVFNTINSAQFSLSNYTITKKPEGIHIVISDPTTNKKLYECIYYEEWIYKRVVVEIVLKKIREYKIANE